MRILGLGVLVAVAVSCRAQSGMPMPGMPMPPAPAKQPQKPQKHEGIPGMAPDMKGMAHDAGDRKAQRNAASEADAVRQQERQPEAKPGATSEQISVQYPMQEMQEPEAPEFRTGGDLPAPELLGEVVAREPLTLEQVMRMADGANPTLAEAQRNVDRSNEQARQVGLPPDPTVGYSGDHIRGGEYRGGEQGAFVSQEFVLGRKLALRRKVYLAEGRANQYALEVQRARVHNDVARAFFDTLAAQQSVVLHDRLLKVALDADTNAHELMRVGQADAAAVLTAEVGAEQARIDFVAAQRAFLGQFAQLATLAGQGNLEVHPLRGSLVEPPAMDVEAYVQRDAEESPLVKQAQATAAMSEAKLKDARRERVPNLQVTAGEWNSGEPVRSGARAGWESFVQAGVQVPLWNRNQGNVEAARAVVERTQREVERTKLWTRNQTAPLAQAYQTARFTAERYRTEMLPRARREYELEVVKYQQMSQEYPPVLAAQRMLFTLQLGYTEALNQEWHAAIALQNCGLMNGLDAPASVGSDSTTVNVPTNAGPGM